ncbi:Fur family transcriptional regulator, partial [Lacticaseibacillus paracasei]
HHHHFICTNCGKVIELKMCPLNYFEKQVPGAKIQSHNFELYGLCAECQQHADRLKNA